MRNHAAIVVCTLVLGAAAYSATRPLLHVGCNGAIDIFPNTGATAIHIDPPAKLVFDTFMTILKERVRQQCPSITDTQFQYGFSYGPGYWLNLFSSKRVWTIPGCNTSVFSEAVLGVQEFPFDGERLIVNWPAAESSCSSDKWASGSGCAMQVSLPKYGVAGVVTMGHCSNSLWPDINVYCEGANCDNIGKFCNSNADCPSPAMCWHWGLDEDDIWGLATEMGIYNRSDTKPGCKNVLTMFDELKEYFMTQVFTATALDETPDVPICFVNFTALDDDPLGTLGITELVNSTTEHYDCKDYCSPSGVFPQDFPPNFSHMDADECSYSRYSYYCGYIYDYATSKGLSTCDIWRLEMACATKIGCDSTSLYYTDAFYACETYGCAECTPVPSWNPTDYPPPLIANNCSWEIQHRCENYAWNWYYYHGSTEYNFNYCHRHELMLNCEHYLGCPVGGYNNMSCYGNRCNNQCSLANITINFNLISSYTGPTPSYNAHTAPTISPMVAGSSTLIKHTCDGWIMLFPGSSFSIKLHVGHQDILSWLHSWLKAPEDCRAIEAGGSALNWWQFEARFGWLPLALLLQSTMNVPAESELGATISDFRTLLEMPDVRLNIPETCTFAKWLEDGKCALKYTGFSSLLQADVTLLLQATKCSASGALPDIQIDCAGSGCQLFAKPVPCATPGSSAGCPAGTMCWNLDSELGDQISNSDLLSYILFKNPDKHIASNAFHNMVHTILKALGSGDTSANNYYCFFSPYGSHLLDIVHNTTFAEDWIESQYKTQGDEFTLLDLKSWDGSSGGGGGDGSDSTVNSAGITEASASLLIIAAIINRLLL